MPNLQEEEERQSYIEHMNKIENAKVAEKINLSKDTIPTISPDGTMTSTSIDEYVASFDEMPDPNVDELSILRLTKAASARNMLVTSILRQAKELHELRNVRNSVLLIMAEMENTNEDRARYTQLLREIDNIEKILLNKLQDIVTISL